MTPIILLCDKKLDGSNKMIQCPEKMVVRLLMNGDKQNIEQANSL
jgi:hypothetical protein